MLHKNVWRIKGGNGQLESTARNGRGCEKLKGECPSKRHPYVLAPVDQCPWHSFSMKIKGYQVPVMLFVVYILDLTKTQRQSDDLVLRRYVQDYEAWK